MKKYIVPILFAVLLCGLRVSAADFGDLLSRLDSRDFSAEKDVALRTDGVYKGETINPHEDTVMFKARDEFLTRLFAAKGSPGKIAEVNSFVIDALKQNVQSDTKAWLVYQLTFSGTGKEVPALTELLKGKDSLLVDAAASALGKIPGPEATAALEQNAGIPAAKAALVGRNTVPPKKIDETEMPLGLSNASESVFAAWMAKYESLAEPVKVQTLAALACRADMKYRDKVTAAIKSDSPALQKAGFLALEKMATKDDAPYLVSRLADEKRVALRIASFIVADGFDDALLELFRKEKDPARLLDLVQILANRAVDVRADVFARTTAQDCPNRLALLDQVAKLATKDDIPSLVASTVLIPRGREHDQAENLVATVCNQDAAPLIKLLDTYSIAVVYPMMCRVGGKAARAELGKSLKSTDPAVLEIALRSLAQWPDATFADTMLELVRSGKYPEAINLSIFRGYIRVVSLPDDKIGVNWSRDEKLARLQAAYKDAKRLDEKKLILSRLSANRTDKSLAFAVECAADPQVAEDAYNAIAEHAHDTSLRKDYPKPMMEAIMLVIGNSKNAKLVERVKIYKGRMEQ